MASLSSSREDRISLAILALGGQGGGVLADWIIEVAKHNGYVAQGTSVPGVAQRTGSTVYYIEMVRAAGTGSNRVAPVMALMPVPGDVDVVLASELMEAGRAILRGFVSSDRTSLIASTHRIYAISEKSVAGNGIAAAERILDAAERRSAHFVGFDMDAAAAKSGSLISAVMLGALAGSGRLPFPTAAFEDAIRRSGKAVAANLAGFAAGREGAQNQTEEETPADTLVRPTSSAGAALYARIGEALPEPLRDIAIEGVRRLMDYQDAAYAGHYLDRIERLWAASRSHPDCAMPRYAARHLALWMAYEDIARVADLKIREARFARIGDEARIAEGQLMAVTEYMHPRLREIADVLPARVGAWLLGSPRTQRLLSPLFRRGRHVETTRLRWYLLLRLIAASRRMRRASLRFREEAHRIERWIEKLIDAMRVDPELGVEIARLPSLIKGYSDTYDRGWKNYSLIMDEAERLWSQPDCASRIRALREAALADDSGCTLDLALTVRDRAAAA